jgi:hypothetical protein
LLVETYSYKREIEFEDEEADGEFGDIDHDGVPTSNGMLAKFAFVDGALVIEWADVQGGFDRTGEHVVVHGWVLAAGRYTLTKLLGLPVAP